MKKLFLASAVVLSSLSLYSCGNEGAATGEADGTVIDTDTTVTELEVDRTVRDIDTTVETETETIEPETTGN